jgi:hypothetical protein
MCPEIVFIYSWKTIVVTYSIVIKFSRAVRDGLNNTHDDRWLGRRGPTLWPPRSPDLNYLDFYLWEHLNSFMFAAPVDHRAIVTYQTIRNCLGIFEGIPRSMMRHVEAWTESHGDYYKCFRSRVDMDIFPCFGMWKSCQGFVCTFQFHPVYNNGGSFVRVFRNNNAWFTLRSFLLYNRKVSSEAHQKSVNDLNNMLQYLPVKTFAYWAALRTKPQEFAASSSLKNSFMSCIPSHCWASVLQ